MKSDYKYANITSGVYCIVNKVNNMMYVGSAHNIRKRRTEHYLALRKNKHANRYLQFAYNKYTDDSFEFKILKVIDDATLEDLIQCEQGWIDWLNTVAPNGYNLKALASSNLGYKHTEQYKETMRRIKLGTKASQETKDKMSQTRKGISKSKEWSAKIGLANRKADKWPHEKGNRCRCRICLDQRNEMRKNQTPRRFELIGKEIKQSH